MPLGLTVNFVVGLDDNMMLAVSEGRLRELYAGLRARNSSCKTDNAVERACESPEDRAILKVPNLQTPLVQSHHQRARIAILFDR